MHGAPREHSLGSISLIDWSCRSRTCSMFSFHYRCKYKGCPSAFNAIEPYMSCNHPYNVLPGRREWNKKSLENNKLNIFLCNVHPLNVRHKVCAHSAIFTFRKMRCIQPVCFKSSIELPILAMPCHNAFDPRVANIIAPSTTPPSQVQVIEALWSALLCSLCHSAFIQFSTCTAKKGRSDLLPLLRKSHCISIIFPTNFRSANSPLFTNTYGYQCMKKYIANDLLNVWSRHQRKTNTFSMNFTTKTWNSND